MQYDQLRSDLKKDGFVVLRQFVSGDVLSTLQLRIRSFIEERVPSLPPEHVFYENKQDLNSLKQIQQLGQHDPWFKELVEVGRFPELAAGLLESKAVPKNLQYFNKPPGIGKATPPHQDGFYFMLSPYKALTMWLALDSVDEENGCVRYVRNSNRHGMRKHSRTSVLGFSQGIVDFPTDEDRESEVKIFAEPGDLLVHDALTIHFAGGNQSTCRTRRALGLIYYSENAKEDRGRHEAYQQQLAEEMRVRGQI